MTALIQEFLQHRRMRDIRWIAKDRRVNVLCHFTRIENLCSILQEGLLGRSLLDRRRTQFISIDERRGDGCAEAVCLTVSFPNYRMFFGKREYYWKNHGVYMNQWIVLLFEADLLWELDCAFCQQNAAHSSVTRHSLEDRRKPEAFERIFFDFEDINRLDLDIPRNYPTNPQAEILVFDTIPISYLREIHFLNSNAWDHLSDRDFVADNADVVYSDLFFRARKDYEVWKSDPA